MLLGLASGDLVAKKTASKRRSSSSSKGRAKTAKVMQEYKHGSLKSGGKKKVKSRKQAVAIGWNEVIKSGAKIPRKRKKS